MDINNKRKRGGQFKLSLAEKKEIVDSYFQLDAGGDPTKLRAYNVYTQLAKYAKDLDWKSPDGREIKPKDFSSQEIREYINELASAAEQISCANLSSVPVYTPLDYISLTTKSFDDVIQIIKTRESYLESVCVNAGRLSLQCTEFQRELNRTKNTLSNKEVELASANNRISELEYELDALMSRYKRLQKLAKEVGAQGMQEHFDKISQSSNNIEKEYLCILEKKIGEHRYDVALDNENEDYGEIEEWDYDG